MNEPSPADGPNGPKGPTVGPDLPVYGAPSDGPAHPGAGAPARRGRRVVATAVAAFAVAAGAVGVSTLTAADGADSPEAAVEAFFTAMEREDLLGVAEAIDPREREVVRPALESTGDEARRLGLASDALDLRDLQGVEIEVDGLTLDSTTLQDGWAAVDVTDGTLTASADLREIPVGAVIAELIDDEIDAGGNSDETTEADLSDLRLVTVRRDGGWHVSLLYSAAEAIRSGLDDAPPRPVYGEGIPAEGASSPEEAVREAVDAAAARDVRRLIAVTSPEEAAVLHDYGEILVDMAGEPDDSSSISVDDLGLETTEGPDGTRLVSASSFEVTYENEWERMVWVSDGECMTTTYEAVDPDDSWPGQTTSVCEGDLDPEGAGPWLGWTFSLGTTTPTVTTEEVDGRWYVAPARSVLDTFGAALAVLDADDAERFARWISGETWQFTPDELWEACGTEPPSLDDPDAFEGALRDCIASLPDDYAGPWYGLPDDGAVIGVPDVAMPDEGVWACVDDSRTADELEGCLRGLVESGELPVEQLAPWLCEGVYLGIDEGSTEEELETAEDAYEACIERAGTPDPSDAPTATTAPTPTTVPAPTVPTTTVPAPTTTAGG